MEEHELAKLRDILLARRVELLTQGDVEIEPNREDPTAKADEDAQPLNEMEQVIECQTPLFLAVEYSEDEDPIVTLIISAPPEAPTTRGFAGVLIEGLSGQRASAILAVPDDIPNRLGLTNALTPLRLRGMSALLGRIKRNITTHLS